MRRWCAFAGLLAAVLVAYSNHFGNSFHFDDLHTIVSNPAIRSLNLGRFWRDSSGFSVEPTGRTYRPVVVTSLALDYRLGGGLKPFWFHLSTFVWFAALLLLIFLLAERLFDGRSGAALLTAAIFGLHPASAETVNYVVQRADLYVALSVVAGIWLYARFPRLRRFGLYLLPPLAGILSKATAVAFVPIFLTYLLLLDRDPKKGILVTLGKSVPACATCLAGMWLLQSMTLATFSPTSGFTAFDYRITQPYVALRMFRTFFLPLHLSGDTDLLPCHSIGDLHVLSGFAFIAIVLAAAVLAARHRRWRPVSFGLWWFLLGQLPTAVYPLGELENDHRDFLPFIGLSLAVVWTLTLLLRLESAGRVKRVACACAAAALLIVAGWGTWQRNQVWHTEESFWSDVTTKSPNNGRAWTNYSFALLDTGKAEAAWSAALRAQSLTPNLAMLHVGLARSGAALHHQPQEVEAEFRHALSINPLSAAVSRDFGEWLLSQGRTQQAMEAFQHAVDVSPEDFDSLRQLLPIYTNRKDWDRLQAAADQLARLLPSDLDARRSAALAESRISRRDAAERAVARNPVVENYIALAAIYADDGQTAGAIGAAKRALELRPGDKEALRILADAGAPK